MRSFTSNFKYRTLPWRRFWATTLLLVVALVAAFETAARVEGHVPMVRDGKDLWAFWREQASDGDPRTVVMLGESKFLMDMDPKVLSETLGYGKVLQLAIAGRSPVPVLKDLADDPKFKGIVLCSFIAEELASSDLMRRGDSEKYVEFYHVQWNAFRRLIRVMRTFFEEHLVLLHPQNIAPKFLSHLLRGKKMKVWYLRMFEDRSYQADFTKADIHLNRMTREIDERFRQPDLPYSEGRAILLADELKGAVAKIASRGGKVVLIHHISSGKLLDYDKKFFPRDRYWDVFVKRLGVPGVHFEDLPGIRRFDCPDWDHLDFRDQRPYTALLARAVREKLLEGERA